MRPLLGLLISALLVASPAVAAPQNYSQDASQAVSSSWSVSTLTADGDLSRAFPQQGFLSFVTCELSSISSATSITWYVALDAAGEKGITPQQTDTISDHDADNSGHVARTVGVLVVNPGGAIYVAHKTDTGTATAKCRGYWE